LILIQAVKYIAAVSIIASYFIVTIPLYPLILLFPFRTRMLINLLVSLYSKLLLVFLRTKLTVKDLRGEDREKALIVCNHLSYIDILILSSKIPTCFITSQEIKETPILGQICTLAGCLFVERRSRKNILNEIKEIEVALKNNLNVLFFPEAKSTNGDKVQPFKRSLFQAAINTGHAVLPLTLNYKALDGHPITQENRDLICWYDDMEFAPHLWEVCGLRSLEVELTIHPKISTQETEDDSAKLRDRSFELISGTYKNLAD
tara:strand:+ start:23442 stop:24224 length:783 start_codon:yes stop_codon:yes gene_type:complete